MLHQTYAYQQVGGEVNCRIMGKFQSHFTYPRIIACEIPNYSLAFPSYGNEKRCNPSVQEIYRVPGLGCDNFGQPDNPSRPPILSSRTVRSTTAAASVHLITWVGSESS